MTLPTLRRFSLNYTLKYFKKKPPLFRSGFNFGGGKKRKEETRQSGG
jgi:hypothetical protein